MDLKYLNQKLRDALGVSESGDPLYQWKHSRDLTVRMLEKGGYDDVPQLEDDGGVHFANKWAIAKWMPPMHTREQYRAAFGDSMPYPRNGRYTVTDTILPTGIEPTERVTDNVIGAEKFRRHLNEMQQMQHFEERRRKSDAEKSRISADILDDAQLPFGHVPGAKDHVSFGGL